MSKRMKQSMCRSNHIFSALFSGSFNTRRNARVSRSKECSSLHRTRAPSHDVTPADWDARFFSHCKHNIEYIGHLFIFYRQNVIFINVNFLQHYPNFIIVFVSLTTLQHLKKNFNCLHTFSKLCFFFSKLYTQNQ